MGRQEQISMIRERKKETKTDTVLLILVLLLAVFGLVMLYYSAPVNIMAEYVSATLPIILKSSFLQQLWAL